MKKLLVTALTTVLVVSMVACGGKNDVKNENTETPAVSTESTTTETTEAETTETAATETVVTDGELTTGDTLGQTLLNVFKDQLAANPEATAQELADAVITNEAILFMGGSMPMEQGLLSGFGNTEIKGFEEAVAFMPMMGSIPFVGYIFDMPADADLEAFMTTLKENADMRWQICVEAEEMFVEAVGDKVFFLMCPKSLEG